jgi:hypothetical protein
VAADGKASAAAAKQNVIPYLQQQYMKSIKSLNAATAAAANTVRKEVAPVPL